MTVPCIDHGQKGNHGGYARVRHKGKTERLHRVVYCAAHGLEISEIAGKVVRHTCDNSRCINPDHLLLGTHTDNMRDMVGRGRGVHPNPRLLTDAQVDEIRATCVPNGNGDHSPNPLSYAALGRKFGVNARAVREAFLHINY